MPASSLPRRARYERGAARVFAPDGEPVGAGFLLDDDLLCTCAHVVAEPDGSRPVQPVVVDFPLLAGAEPGPRVAAVVESWWPEDDVAHLRLSATVDGTEPLPLADGSEDEWNRDIRAFGFPPQVSRGVNATGTLRGRQRADLIQLDLTAPGVRIGPGFSGAAVWDPAEEAVVGMLTTRGRGPVSDTAYLLAADRLTDPDALPCPFRGLARFESEHARYFHGREDEVRKLVRALETRPVTVLVGPSGSGKSSLLRAGLLAAVRKQGTPWALRVPEPADAAGAPAEDADTWVAEAVAAAWHSAVPDDAARRDRFEEVRAACAGDEAGLRVLRGRLTHELGSQGAVLLLDQFEEYAVASPQGALRSFRALSALAQAPDPAQGGGLRVVLTARSTTLEALTAADTSARLDGAVQFLAPMTAEALTRAVQEPVRAVAGLRLEEGLARRLVSDAVDEPGCLPLLQFALTRLWEQRKAHTMTHAAYERTGGVVKALAEYADEALRDCLASTGASEDTARRLFEQLARPDGQGGFTRRAAPIRQLSPEQAALARALAGRRLLVWDVVERPGPAGKQAGTVQVVHEALLREWERPAAWLHEGADFLEWHERTARDAAEWDGAGRPDGLLPHGARLAEGLQWLADRPDDLTDTERAYLEAGRRRQRRGLRRLWGVTALVTVLAVLASTLAVSTYRALQRDRAQLRTAAAAELGTLAADVADRSPDSAFRYAAGAWTARHTPQSQQALFAQYVRAADVTSSHSGLWPGSAQWTSMSPDGRTMVVLSRRDGAVDLTATVVTGAVDGRPRATPLRGVPTGLRVQDFRDAISADGRRYALVTLDGRVLLWDLSAVGARPRQLSAALPARGGVEFPHVDFSDDGTRLLHFFPFNEPRPEDDGRKALVRLWDTDSGRALPVSQRVVEQQNPTMAWLPGDGERVAVAGSRAKGEQRYLDLHDTASGERVRRVYGPQPAVNQEPAGRGVWLDVAGGVRWYSLYPEARQPVRTYSGGVTFRDLTGTHLYRDATPVSGETGNYRRVTVRDPKERDRFWSLTLPGRDGSRALGVVGEGSGPRTVLAVEGDTLLRSRPEPVSAVANELFSRSGDAAALSPDGSRTARLRAGRLEVTGPGVRTRHTLLPGKMREIDGWKLHLTWVTRKGGDALLVWSDYFTYARLYDADTLRSRGVTWDCGRSGDPTANQPQDIVQTDDGDLVLLCLGDTLVRLDPRSGVQSGGPVRLEHTPAGRGMFQNTGRLTTRPGHPHQVAVVTGPWRASGRIELWDVRRGTRVARLEGGPLPNGSFLDDDVERWVVFTPDGNRLAAFDEERRVVWWDVDGERPEEPTRAIDDATGFLGVAPDGTLLVVSSGVSLVSPDDAEPLGQLNGGDENLHAARITGDTLHLVTDKAARTLRLSPAAWHDTLCAALDGPNSPSQRNRPVLDMARNTPPCPST
ncbi:MULTISPECIES: trypsin-like peptidase domain-containing protein [unclassified Streptomyces]|uniref:nSTAND1 domain-containing NTPase n=1 Tax=unclassified Streptomyces TaxID=2593676 RepID=UPI0033A99B7A